MVESGTGSMRFMASDFKLQNFAGTHEYIVMTDGGSVAISHGNGKKFETTTTGATVPGTVNVNNAYTLPTTDGTSGQVLQTDGSGVLVLLLFQAEEEVQVIFHLMPVIYPPTIRQ